MKKYKCTVAYIGAEYDGWQSQKQGLSVQEKIEEAVRRITGVRTNITAAGRTDAGVNARGQVFMFESERDLSPRKWAGAINGFLPPDIRITQTEEVDPHLFHARYNVRMKHYDYLVHTGAYDVFTRDYAYQLPVKLDVEKMKEAAVFLIGTHDFTSFNANSLAEKPDQVRTVKNIVITQNGEMITMSFYGKGFLRHMVRMMAAELLEVGKGRMTPADLKTVLEAKSKTVARKNAPANGLTLVDIDYFEILAINENGMVREFLEGDDISFLGQSLEELEEAVRRRRFPFFFILTGRSDQTARGLFALQKEKAVLRVYAKDDLALADQLRPDLEQWLKKEGIAAPLEIIG